VKTATLHRSDFVQQNVANTKTNNSIQMPMRLLAEYAKVEELIDQDTRWWYIHLIK
jgi:hypothetical protein